MTGQDETTADVLKSVWINSHDHDEMDEECSPTKSCRNMKDVTFDGYAEPGSDLERPGEPSWLARASWARRARPSAT